MICKYFYVFLISTFTLFTGSQLFADELSGLDEQIVKLELKRHEKLLAEIATTTEVLIPFISDGCSGGLSVGWNYIAGKIPKLEAIHGSLPPWESCCVNHDRVYHSGAIQGDTSIQSFNRRKEADSLLKACVIETGQTRSTKLLAKYDVTSKELDTIYLTIAELMYKAVRLGGIPCSGLPWRWGFGWPTCM